ncbi:MAG: protein-export chaperone SecB [Azospirillaceae bacterium]
MTDDANKAGNAAAGTAGQGATAAQTGAQAGAQAVPQIQIVSQYVKDLSFENPNAPGILTGQTQPPQVKVNVDTRPTQLDGNRYEVALNLRADATIDGTQAFIVELSYGGVVALDPSTKKEHHAPLLLIEAPRQMFPFARAVIAEAVRNGGFPPLLIQPIDFTDLFRRQVQRLAQAQQGQAGGAAPAGTAPGGSTPAGSTPIGNA